jgi:rhamnulose-1-phosphate aldolase/alcohol dehydrogenase
MDSPDTTGAATPFRRPANAWADEAAAAMTPEELLLYRSHLLGRDLAVTNFGGGNTSAKIAGVDPVTGQPVDLLWVKGSGGDLGSMKLDGFAVLDRSRLLALTRLYRGEQYEDEMVGHFAHCVFGPGGRPPSIDTPLHAFIPYAHVDHVHPDAVIALAASDHGREAVETIWQGRVGWIAWRRPGFALGLELGDFVAAHPDAVGAVLAGHGLICWADTSRACHDLTLGLIADAADYLNTVQGTRPAFGGAAVRPAETGARRAEAARMMAALRRRVSQLRPKAGHFTDDPTTLEFVCSRDLDVLAERGTSCPDHFLRTKVRPLVVRRDAPNRPQKLDAAVEDYRARYRAYHARWVGPADPPVRDADPVVVLVPGLGRFAFAADKTTARIASEFYGNAINVMRGATAIGDYVGLDEREAFRVEYWALEEAKLRRMPPPRPLSGLGALVTGAAGGIGEATARKLLEAGASVMICDRDGPALDAVRTTLIEAHGPDRVRASVFDILDPAAVDAAFESAVLAFGGVDIAVCNAGIASAASIAETTTQTWRLNHSVLAEGTFICARAAFMAMDAQGGGSIVIVGSKNGVAPASGASAYASAKAASIHLARCLALEGGPKGIRVNVVNPDAVIRGSKIWDGRWREERAEAYGIDPGAELEAHYRARSLLGLDVLPEDVADAILHFAGSASAKSTGNMLNVDAGNPQSFTR